jgi:hypothetical protein
MIHRVGTVRSDLHLPNGIEPRATDTFYRDANVRQVFGKALVVDREIDIIANPVWREFHSGYWLLAIGL